MSPSLGHLGSGAPRGAYSARASDPANPAAALRASTSTHALAAERSANDRACAGSRSPAYPPGRSTCFWRSCSMCSAAEWWDERPGDASAHRAGAHGAEHPGIVTSLPPAGRAGSIRNHRCPVYLAPFGKPMSASADLVTSASDVTGDCFSTTSDGCVEPPRRFRSTANSSSGVRLNRRCASAHGGPVDRQHPFRLGNNRTRRHAAGAQRLSPERVCEPTSAAGQPHVQAVRRISDRLYAAEPTRRRCACPDR